MPYGKLLEPGRIGILEARNRIVMAPMGTNLGETDGRVSARTLDYYEARARGGAGIVTIGVAAIAYPKGQAIPRQLAISDDRFLPGLTELVERIHKHGAKAAVQIQHAGKVATQDISRGEPLWVPSPVSYADAAMEDLTADEMQRLVSNLMTESAKLEFHEMNAADIAQVVSWFTGAAERAKRAGFDAVELHAGHGYAISAFLSPATNHRTDEYGGAPENRARFLVETIRAVKERVGREFPVWCRVDAHEYRIEGGITIEQCRETAKFAEAAGADALHVSAYGNPFSGIAFTEGPLVHAPGGYVPFAAEIKRNVGIPVIAVGRITPEEGDRIIGEGKADFIAMGRRLLADPELPNKLRDGRAEDIRPCVYCYTCVGKIFVNESVVCAVNPATGREAEFAIDQAAQPKEVLIAGGGPAGMEAARVAALRGHRVTLCEKEHRLGGTFFFSSLLWEPNGDLVDYLARRVRKLPISLRLDREVTPELVAGLKPDVVIVATGAKHETPTVPGIDRRNVLSGDDLRAMLGGNGGAALAAKLAPWQRLLVTIGRLIGAGRRPALARTLSTYWLPLGRRVAVIGGGLVGVEVAQFLAERGREVTVLEEGDWLAPQMAIPRRWRALYELRERGATLFTGVRIDAVTADGVAMVTKEGEERTVAADHVILATGVRTNPDLADALRGQGCNAAAIGDCRDVRYVEGAMADAARLARKI